MRLIRAEKAVAAFRPGDARPHDLPGELVVSLTSYPGRYGTLAKTLKGLLAQTVKPDRMVLWIADADKTHIPEDVKRLREFGLEIRVCPDLRSYNKIIHSLKSWPDAYIVTADDDLYYEPRWLETLVGGVSPHGKVIVCRRALKPVFDGSAYAPYKEWPKDVVTRGEVRGDLFPTGCGGVLYPPYSLAPEVLDVDTLTAICPHEDDVWLYFMGRRAGSLCRQVGGGFAQVMWAGSQATSLMQINLLHDGNAEQIRAVAQRFPPNSHGTPAAHGEGW